MDNLVRVTITTSNPDMALSIQDWIIRHYPVKEIKIEDFDGKNWTRRENESTEHRHP
jgi:hypothetical protein